jgi:endoglucanase
MKLSKCSNMFVLNLLLAGFALAQSGDTEMKLNKLGYFEKRGLQVLVFNNWYNGEFSDAKMAGIELIHHGVRTATNGDVRLSPTPGQWDPVPKMTDRKINAEDSSVEVHLSYPDYDFDYVIEAKAQDDGVLITVDLTKPLPADLEGRAGFNLEFLPSAYFEKTYMIDGRGGTFPLYPSESMEVEKSGDVQPEPIASGKTIVLAPEDSMRMVTIRDKDGELSLFDGRNLAQNGWYVVRSLIPSGKSGTVVKWLLTANTIPNWTRPPVIEYSQVGYNPEQKKVAVFEFDVNDHPLSTARLMKVTEDGKFVKEFEGELKPWGEYLRYNYSTFDFSAVKDSGTYVIEYGNERTGPFRIAADVYENAWQPTLDVYLPVQMDHMFVREAYRIWHGAAHLDDALQAPINHEHFDLYAQGPTTDSPYKPLEHIPGLNVGGWFDAGDYDIRTETQYAVVLDLVHAWEKFHLTRDETTVNEKTRYVEIHRPDGVPDIIQQIEHGTLQLLAQFKSVGHAINGIIEAHLSQYRLLGDAASNTDNLIYNPKLDSLQSDGFTSGTFDDRWAFTSRSSALDYGSIAALAAASRALKGYDDSLANDCLTTATKVWDEEHSHPPYTFRHGNTTGGPLEVEELKAAIELLICTKDKKYADRITELMPTIKKSFYSLAVWAVRAIPYMNDEFSKQIEVLAQDYANNIDKLRSQNPFGVPVSMRGWAGDGLVINFAITNYMLHKAFPRIIDKEDVFSGLNYIYGCHPGSNISFVSGIGTQSKKVAYGNNRADFTFIAGGIVPGVLILKPDFPENKEDWPFLWGENEYVVNLGASYIFLVNAANSLLNEK